MYANNGELEMLRKGHELPALILLDIKIPGMAGCRISA
jgi:CheY-like chemotaxis protein